MHLLLLQFEPDLARRLTQRLTSARHGVQWCTHVDQARQLRSFDLALLDIESATGPVLDLLTAWRSSGMDQPVALVSAREQSRSRAKGLLLGAHVGLIKPLDVDDVLCWVESASEVREHPRRQALIDRLKTGLDSRRAQCGKDVAALTSLEWAVLMCLAQREGRIYSRPEIEGNLRGHGVLSAASNSVEVIVSRLRKKVGPELISTHWGIGYRLEI
jgi:two-component system OmpR family response regulator